jgi:signal transduction histidine kinase
LVTFTFKDLPEGIITCNAIEIVMEENEEQIECRVMDSGAGISAEIVPTIFNPFYTTKEAGKGTGLGLSIVKDILQEHSATIEYDSDSPSTCFVLSFPKLKNCA